MAGWVNCKHRALSYFVTQFLTGHGSYFTYTKRIGKTPSDDCPRCGVTDSPSHMLYSCGRWDLERQNLSAEIGPIPPTQDLVGSMCGSKQVWDAVTHFIHLSMAAKEQEDRARIRRLRNRP